MGAAVGPLPPPGPGLGPLCIPVGDRPPRPRRPCPCCSPRGTECGRVLRPVTTPGPAHPWREGVSWPQSGCGCAGVRDELAFLGWVPESRCWVRGCNGQVLEAPMVLVLSSQDPASATRHALGSLVAWALESPARGRGWGLWGWGAPPWPTPRGVGTPRRERALGAPLNSLHGLTLDRGRSPWWFRSGRCPCWDAPLARVRPGQCGARCWPGQPGSRQPPCRSDSRGAGNLVGWLAGGCNRFHVCVFLQHLSIKGNII